MTKLSKLTSILILALVAFIIPLSSCDDHGLYFTVDDVEDAEGHVKQVSINTKISVPVGVFFVNVQGAKGNIVATSWDSNIAQVEVLKGYHIPRLSLKLLKVGDVVISVMDEDGNSANLFITVVPKVQ